MFHSQESLGTHVLVGIVGECGAYEVHLPECTSVLAKKEGNTVALAQPMAITRETQP